MNETPAPLVAPVGWAGLRSALVAAGDLVLPARCACCPAAEGPLCRDCRGGVRDVGFAGGPRPVALDAAPAGIPRCWSAARFEGPLRTAVTAYKDQDRRDLAPVLARLLASALVSALGAEPVLRRAVSAGIRVLVVPMPASRASRRRRGDDPVRTLAGCGVRLVAGPLVLAPAVRHGRAVADQSGLGREDRARNLHGALRLQPAWHDVVARAPCVLVDDVVTTGATLCEAARVLLAAGAADVVAVTVAATPRRRDAPDPRRVDVPLVGR